MGILKTWWKVRKIFKFPKLSFYTCKSGYTFYFQNTDVRYKWKWDYICVEDPPKLRIVLFKREFGLILTWPYNEYEDEDFYWESILNYLYLYDKDIEKTIKESGNVIKMNGEKYPIVSKNYLK